MAQIEWALYGKAEPASHQTAKPMRGGLRWGLRWARDGPAIRLGGKTLQLVVLGGVECAHLCEVHGNGKEILRWCQTGH